MLFLNVVYAQAKDWNDCLLDGKIPTLSCVEVVIARIIRFSAGLVLFILFIMFLVGAYHYLTAFGSEEKVKKAQGTIKYAVIGLVIFISSYLILRIIGQVFLGDPNALLRFEITPNPAP